MLSFIVGATGLGSEEEEKPRKSQQTRCIENNTIIYTLEIFIIYTIQHERRGRKKGESYHYLIVTGRTYSGYLCCESKSKPYHVWRNVCWWCCRRWPTHYHYRCGKLPLIPSWYRWDTTHEQYERANYQRRRYHPYPDGR